MTKKYEYGVHFADTRGYRACHSKGQAKFVMDYNVDMGKPCTLVRREVGQWEEMAK